MSRTRGRPKGSYTSVFRSMEVGDEILMSPGVKQNSATGYFHRMKPMKFCTQKVGDRIIVRRVA